METEWQLLTVAESVLKGDRICVEEESGESTYLIFLRVKGECVYLKNDEGEVRMFSAESLEEEEGYGIIRGTVEDDE